MIGSCLPLTASLHHSVLRPLDLAAVTGRGLAFPKLLSQAVALPRTAMQGGFKSSMAAASNGPAALAIDHTCTHNEVHAAVKAIHASRCKAVIYATGGAAQALPWLLCVPGASATVLEASVPYSREAVVDLVGKEPTSYCDGPAALALAQAAYRRAAQLCGFGEQFVGIAATCALATEPPKRGNHRAYVASFDGHISQVSCLTLAKGVRSRWQEDALASHLLIKVLARASGCGSAVADLPPTTSSSAGAGDCDSLQEFSTSRGDPLEALLAGTARCVEFSWPTNSAPDQRRSSISRNSSCSSGGAAAAAADANAAALELAAVSAVGAVHASEPSPRSALDKAIVVVDAPRRHTVTLPGSFNPLHEGHQKLLAAAVATVRAQSDAHALGCFELSIGNPDKGMLPIKEVRRRVAQFGTIGVPVMVTVAPRFTDKASLLPGTRFVVGYDTAARLVMPKYYGDPMTGGSEDAMLQDFDRLRSLGCRFLVAGRTDPVSGMFKTLTSVSIRPALADLFTAIPDSGEEGFRMDISSTEIRQRMAEEEARRRLA